MQMLCRPTIQLHIIFQTLECVLNSMVMVIFDPPDVWASIDRIYS